MKSLKFKNKSNSASIVEAIRGFNSLCVSFSLPLFRRGLGGGVLLFFMSISTFAQFSGGSGTSASPYEITTAAQLAQLATFVNEGNTAYNAAFYILKNDINLSGYNNGKGWIPIGRFDNLSGASFPFKGNFNGGNKIITNLYVNDGDLFYAGLFGFLEGSVSNVGVEGNLIKGKECAGGISGNLLWNSSNENSGYITNCYSKVVSITAKWAGGITGYMNSSEIADCFSTSAISGNEYAGGIAGVSFVASIKNCWATGSVTCTEWGAAGGILGNMDDHLVEKSVALNPSVKSQKDEGRIIGSGDGWYFNNAAYDGMIDNEGATNFGDTGASTLNGASISKSEIYADGTFGNLFTAANGWTTQNGKLPGLFGKTVEMPIHLLNLEFEGGDGSEENPFIIVNAEQLRTLAIAVNEKIGNYNIKCYKLVADIDLSDYGSSYNGGKGWIPIGNKYANSFSGGFFGNGFKIKNIYIDNEDGTHNGAGLFGCLNLGQISGLVVESVNILGKYNSGAVVGYLTNSLITDCSSSGKITGTSNAGGIAGNINELSTVFECNSSCKVDADSNAGGVVGSTEDNCYVNECYSTGNISGESNVGGVVGSGFYQSNILNCYSTGTVSGIESVGGISGYVYGEYNIKNCYSTGKISGQINVGGITGYIAETGSLKNCYSKSYIEGEENVGGIAGYVSDNINVSNCYSIGDVHGINSVGGIVGFLTYHCGIDNCAALQSLVSGETDKGRILGNSDGTTNSLFDNIAWDGILNIDGNISWDNINAINIDGESINLSTIYIDGTLGGRFTPENGWTSENGKLPGLFGNTVEMPVHLVGVGISYELGIRNYELVVYPNPTSGQFTVTAKGHAPVTARGHDPLLESIELFDIFGNSISPAGGGRGWISTSGGGQGEESFELKLDITHLPNGIYILKVNNQSIKVIKK